MSGIYINAFTDLGFQCIFGSEPNGIAEIEKIAGGESQVITDEK